MRTHPDMLHGQPSNVVRTNEASLQALNAFLDLAQARCEGTRGHAFARGHGDPVTRDLASRGVFRLEFFVQVESQRGVAGDEDQPEGGSLEAAELRRLKYRIDVPAWLRDGADAEGVMVRQWRAFTARHLGAILDACDLSRLPLGPLQELVTMQASERQGRRWARRDGRGRSARRTVSYFRSGLRPVDRRQLLLDMIAESHADPGVDGGLVAAASRAGTYDLDPYTSPLGHLRRATRRLSAARAAAERLLQARLGDGTILVDRQAQALQEDTVAYEACERILELLLDNAQELHLTDIGVWGQHVLLISDTFGVRDMASGATVLSVAYNATQDELCSFLAEHMLSTVASRQATDDFVRDAEFDAEFDLDCEFDEVPDTNTDMDADAGI